MKHMEINNCEQYIVLENSYKINCMDKRELTSSESRDYMWIPGKDLTTSLSIRTKIPNKKQNARFTITDINNQDLRKLIDKFKNPPYLGYNSKQVHNEPTEA